MITVGDRLHGAGEGVMCGGWRHPVIITGIIVIIIIIPLLSPHHPPPLQGHKLICHNVTKRLLRHDINTECQHFEDVCNDLSLRTEYIFMNSIILECVNFGFRIFLVNYQFVLKDRG